MENWKKVDGFNGRYSVSNKGSVRNDERGSLVKPMLSTSGYNYVHLVVKRKKHTCYIHRLVGKAFLNNPLNLPQIDHINGCRTDNNVSNLRWVSVSDNLRAYGSKQRSETRSKPVVAQNTNGDKIIFKSRLETAKHFNCSPSKIKYGHLYKKGDKKGWTFNLL